MVSKTKDFRHITQATLRHYDEHASEFWEGTKDHDVSQNYEAFLNAIARPAPLRLLDLGCGPGRDVWYFKSLGHDAVGLDGCQAFCEMARQRTNCEILLQDFLSLGLKPHDFDGIFANAALFHTPKQELPRVLCDLHQALKPEGILFSSNPRGSGEGWSGQRYGAYFEFREYAELLHTAGFRVLNHYYRPPGKPREEQPWLAVVSQKVATKL